MSERINLKNWYEYRLVLSKANKPPSVGRNFLFIKNELLPLIEGLGLDQFHFLNYFEPDKRDYIRFRVHAKKKLQSKIEKRFQEMKEHSKILDFEKEVYNVEGDCLKRTASVRQELLSLWGIDIPKTWRISGQAQDEQGKRIWLVDKMNPKQHLAFWTTFLTKVLGKILLKENKVLKKLGKKRNNIAHESDLWRNVSEHEKERIKTLSQETIEFLERTN